MIAEQPLFTAAEIAAALGSSKRGVQKGLAEIAAEEIQVRGKPALAWRFEALPNGMREDMATIAARRGYRDARALLANPPPRWEPRVPFSQASPAHAGKALKLRQAFAGVLARLEMQSVTDAELRDLGRRDYRSVFGREISGKQWKRLFDRTLNRGAGADDFERPDIYLDDNASAEALPAKAEALLARAEHPELCALIRSFDQPGELKKGEEKLLWQLAFDRFRELTAAGAAPKEARRSLVDFLHRAAPGLAANRNALREAFKYKLAKWQEGGETPSALDDGRQRANAARALVMSGDDQKTVIAFAAKHGGGLSQGWREAQRRGVLSAELTARYIGNPASKSYVPHAVRDALGNDVKQLDDLMHGPRQAKLNGAHIERDPSTYCSGDAFQGDDCTLPNLYFENTPAGPRLMRGQLLILIDVRSFYVLGFVLISAAPDTGSTYNAWHIRNLITAVHDRYGLPRRRFYFENGIWGAKLLTGRADEFADPIQTESGLREFGVSFSHARLPRAKVVERIFNSLQNLTEAEPGYVGRNEAHDRYERTQLHKRRVESGRIPADRHFLTRDEWLARIGELIEQYNSEPQEGKYCRGPHGERLSPREAYETFFGGEPLVRLPENARYLLANQRRAYKVQPNGITIRTRRSALPFIYKGEALSPLINRTVETFFNEESPEILGVKNPDTGEMFAVRRASIVAGFDADPESLQQAHAENAAQGSYARALYRAIEPKFSEHFMRRFIFRPVLADESTRKAGEQLRESATAEREAAQRERRAFAGTRAAVASTGMRVAPNARDPDTQRRAAEKLNALMAKAKSQTAHAP